MSDAVDTAERDAAWVRIESPLPLPEMRRFCADVERLYRINPCFEIAQWETGPGGVRECRIRNLVNGITTAGPVALVQEGEDAFRVEYAQGLKAWTRFELQPAGEGSLLVITEDYGRLEREERMRRSAEVDRSLTAWGWALHAYLRRYRRWRSLSLWRWYQRRVWLPMKPSARRIVALLVLIGIGELALVLLVVAIIALEGR